MPVDAGTIYSEVRIAIDKLKQDILQVETNLDKFGKKNDQQSEQVKKSWTKNFKEINLAGIAAFAAIGYAVKQSIDTFAKFEQSMANVRSVTSASAADFQKLEEAAIVAGESTRFTASQAADAMYYLASAGLNATQVMDSLNGVLQLAGATQSDLAFTASTMAATLSQFSLDAEEATRVSNVFASAISNSQATMEKLQTSMKQVGPIAGALGISLEETTANLEALFNAGFAGEQAGTALRNILLDLSDSTGPVVKQLEALGVTFDRINPKNVGLTGAIEVLSESGIDLGNIFGKRVAAQMLVLAKTGGDALRELENEITNTNAAAEMYATQNDTLAGSIDFLKSAIESAQIKLVDELGPALRGVIDTLTAMVNAFNSLPGFVKLAIGVFAIGIPVVSGFSIAISALSAALAEVAGPITAIIGGIALLSGAIAAVVQAQEDYNNRFKNAADATDKQRSKIDELLTRYDDLKEKSKDNKDAQNELKTVIQALAGILPEAAIEWGEYGEAIDIVRGKAEQYTREELQNELDLRESDLQLRKSQLDSIDKRIKENQELIKTYKAEKEAIEKLLEKTTDPQEILNVQERLNLYKDLILEEQQNLGLLDDENGLLNERTQKLQQIEAIETRMGELRRELDPVLKAQYEAELKRIKDEEDAKKAAAILEEERLQAEELEKQRLADLEEDYAKLRKKFTFDNLSDMDQEIEKVKELKAQYIEAGVNKAEVEEWAQSKIAEIRDKYKDTESEDEKKKADEIKAADEELISIKEQYRQKLEQIGKTQLELIEIERQNALSIIAASDATTDFKNDAINAINEYYDVLRDNTANEEFLQNTMTMTQSALSFFSSLFGTISQLYTATTQQRLAELDRQLQAELEAAGLAEQTELERLETELAAAKEAGDEETQNKLEQDIARLKLEEEFERKKAQIKYEGELRVWRMTLLQAIADGAAAIISAFATKPFIPVGLAAGILATALTGVQIGVVSKSKPKPPQFQTGGLVIPAGPDGREVNVAEGGSSELLLNNSERGRPFLEQFADEIANVVISKIGIQGGVIYLQLNMDGRRVAESSAKYYNNGIVKVEL
jgi:TP901 family phage tail tape measure protein